MHRGRKESAAGREEVAGCSDSCKKIIYLQSSQLDTSQQFLIWLSPSAPKALRCLRGRKRVEKRADNLFAQLETIRGILDRIAQSQTDKMVRRCVNSVTGHRCAAVPRVVSTDSVLAVCRSCRRIRPECLP